MISPILVHLCCYYKISTCHRVNKLTVYGFSLADIDNHIMSEDHRSAKICEVKNDIIKKLIYVHLYITLRSVCLCDAVVFRSQPTNLGK